MSQSYDLKCHSAKEQNYDQNDTFTMTSRSFATWACCAQLCQSAQSAKCAAQSG